MTFDIAEYLQQSLGGDHPIIVVLAGSNGSGKTTFYSQFIAETGIPFVNADNIARSLQPSAPEAIGYEAARVADVVRRDLLLRRVSFCMETVFSDPKGDKVEFLKDAQSKGYFVCFVFIRLSDVSLSQARVQQRVETGGHDVPDEKLANRFDRTLRNAAAALQFVDLGIVLDNSSVDLPFRHVETWKVGVCIGSADSPLPFQASHDRATSLPNLRVLEHRISQILRRRASRDLQGALCVLQIDRLSAVEKQIGPHIVDSLVKDIAARIQGLLPQRSMLARTGRGEFGVIVSDCTLEEAIPLMDAVRRRVNAKAFRIDRRSVSIRISAGVVPVPGYYGTEADALIAARALCASGRRSSQDKVVFLSDRVRDKERWRALQAAEMVRSAIESGSVIICQSNIEDLRPVAEGTQLEFTSHIRTSDSHALSPAEFLRVSEEYGLSTNVDLKLMAGGLQTAARTAETGDLQFAMFNVSGIAITDSSFRLQLLNMIRDADIEMSQICLQLSESTLASNIEELMPGMTMLRAEGIRFSLNHFGTGMSSFSYLRHVPLNYLSIDSSFISGILSNSEDRQLAQSINELAHILGLLTIAEGADTPELLSLLRRIGVDYAQGPEVGVDSRN
jgi:diguanylate cyclase (GGDEF)-like protein